MQDGLAKLKLPTGRSLVPEGYTLDKLARCSVQPEAEALLSSLVPPPAQSD
jgi:hypothetical protein